MRKQPRCCLDFRLVIAWSSIPATESKTERRCRSGRPAERQEGHRSGSPNVDKSLLVGGRSLPAFADGQVLQPMDAQNRSTGDVLSDYERYDEPVQEDQRPVIGLAWACRHLCGSEASIRGSIARVLLHPTFFRGTGNTAKSQRLRASAEKGTSTCAPGLPRLLLAANAVSRLHLTHKPDDRSNLFVRHLRLGRHVPEPPVVLAHTDLDGERKGRITVVSRMIDAVDQRGAFVRA